MRNSWSPRWCRCETLTGGSQGCRRRSRLRAAMHRRRSRCLGAGWPGLRTPSPNPRARTRGSHDVSSIRSALEPPAPRVRSSSPPRSTSTVHSIGIRSAEERNRSELRRRPRRRFPFHHRCRRPSNSRESRPTGSGNSKMKRFYIRLPRTENWNTFCLLLGCGFELSRTRRSKLVNVFRISMRPNTRIWLL